MTLIPEVQAVVDKLNGAEISFTDLTVAEGRQLYVETLARSGGEPAAMAAVDDRQIPGPAGDIAIRRYRPEGLSAAPAPTVIYFHGGGWVLGDLDSHDRICRQLAQRAGCQLIAVDYRLAPEHPLPASSEDAIAAFEWLTVNAAELDIDPKRVAVAGDSAGGQLSAVVALAARDHDWPLAFQALIYPATDLRGAARHYPSRARNGADTAADRRVNGLVRPPRHRRSHRYPGLARVAFDGRFSGRGRAGTGAYRWRRCADGRRRPVRHPSARRRGAL